MIIVHFDRKEIRQTTKMIMKKRWWKKMKNKKNDSNKININLFSIVLSFSLIWLPWLL